MDANILTTLGNIPAVLAGMLGITAYLKYDLEEAEGGLNL